MAVRASSCREASRLHRLTDRRGESHHVVSTCCPWVKRSDELHAPEGEQNFLLTVNLLPREMGVKREGENGKSTSKNACCSKMTYAKKTMNEMKYANNMNMCYTSNMLKIPG